MINYNILIIEDDNSFAAVLQDLLESAHYSVKLATTGQEAIECLNHFHPHLIISDLGLPDIYGLDLIKLIRQMNTSVPYLFLTAQTDEIDIVLGLEQGAEDYICKPFQAREFLARIRKVLNRTYVQKSVLVQNKTLKIGELLLLQEQHEAHLNDQRIDLSLREFDLLFYLASRPNRVCTRQQILDELWPNEYDIIDRIIDTHVSHLRDKLQHATYTSSCIKTLRGVGYMFKV